MELSTLKVLCITVLLQNFKFAATWFWGTKSPPCSNLTTFENYTYPTTQAIANSQSPLRDTSKTEHEDSQVFSVGSIVGVAIGGALFGFVVSATVFVYIHCGFRTGRRGLNNMGYRLDEFNNDKIPNQLGVDSVVYNEITDETQINESSQTMQNKEEAALRDHLHEINKAGRTTSDDYDHAGPALIVVKEPQKGMHNVEQSKEHTDDTDKAKILQTSIHAEVLAKKEHFLEPRDLDTTISDNHKSSATFREDENGMSSKVEELDKILHNVQPTALSECGITSGSENEQNAPYFCLESQ